MYLRSNSGYSLPIYLVILNNHLFQAQQKFMLAMLLNHIRRSWFTQTALLEGA